MSALLMKGHTWRDHRHKMNYPAIAELKVDEIRCHVIVTPNARYDSDHTAQVDYLSFAGKPLHNMQAFSEYFVDLWARTGYSEFDCGFEVNGNFNDSYRWVRSAKGSPADLVNKYKKFILFDLPELRTTFNDRCETREHCVSAANYAGFESLHSPVSYVVRDAGEVDARFLEVREAGYEGLMVKSLDHLYERGKRSYGWLKVKPSEDADGVIVDVHEAISDLGEPLGRAGSVTIAVENDGGTAKPHGIPHALGREMWENTSKFLGQWAEFKYMERDRQGGYRHPVWVRIREAKS